MSEAIIRVRLPKSDEDEDALECSICAYPLCDSDQCSKKRTILSCCDQYMCCGCFAKLLQKCKCSPECEAVIGTCPYCREMCRADAAALFSARYQPCRQCRAHRGSN